MTTSFDWFPVLLTVRIALLGTLSTVLLGTAAGWLLARRRFPGRDLIDAGLTLLLVLPPTALGYYLLVAIGRHGPIGSAFDRIFGFQLVFTWYAALIAAFLHSIPFMVQAARTAIAEVDLALEEAARTMGASEPQIFWYVTLPLARGGLASGAALALARTFGDFGVTLMVAGNIPGRTQTLAVAIYDALMSGDQAAAWRFVAISSLICFVILYALVKLGRSPGG